MPCHPPGATLRQHPGAGAGRTSRPVTDHMLAHEANAQRRAAEIAPAAPVVVERHEHGRRRELAGLLVEQIEARDELLVETRDLTVKEAGRRRIASAISGKRAT